MSNKDEYLEESTEVFEVEGEVQRGEALGADSRFANAGLGVPPPPPPPASAPLPTGMPAPMSAPVGPPQQAAPPPPPASAPLPTGMPAPMSGPVGPPQQAAPPAGPAATLPLPTGMPAPTSAPMPPAPGQPLMVQAPSTTQIALVAALKNLWTVQNDIWSGKVESAFGRPEAVRGATGVSWPGWVVPMVVNSLLFGLVQVGVTFSGLRVASLFGGYDFFGGYYGPPVSYYFKVYFLTVFLAFGAYMLLSLANMLTHRTSGSSTSFVDCATDLATANTVMWLPLSGFFVILMVLPSMVLNVLMGILFAGLLLMVTVLSYLGVSRHGPHKRSPAVPYSWFTVGAWLVLLLVAAVLAETVVQRSFF